MSDAKFTDMRFAAVCRNCQRKGPWVVPSHAKNLGQCHRAAMVKALEAGWRWVFLTTDHSEAALTCGTCSPDFDEADRDGTALKPKTISPGVPAAARAASPHPRLDSRTPGVRPSTRKPKGKK